MITVRSTSLRRVASLAALAALVCAAPSAVAQSEPVLEDLPPAPTEPSIPPWDEDAPMLVDAVDPSARQSWVAPSGFVALGTRFRETAGPGVLIGAGVAVEERGPATRRAGIQGEAMVEQRLFMMTRGSLNIADGGVHEYDVETAVAGLRSTELVEGSVTSIALLAAAPVRLWREPELDRDWGLDASLFRIDATVIYPGGRRSRTIVRFSFDAPGYRHKVSLSDEAIFNGVRAGAFGLTVAQQFGSFGILTIEPSATARADVAIGTQRVKRFATDSLLHTGAGLRLGFGQHIGVVSEIAYRANLNTLRAPNPTAWRVDSGLVVSW